MLYEKLLSDNIVIPPRYESQYNYLKKPIPNNISESYKQYSKFLTIKDMKETYFHVNNTLPSSPIEKKHVSYTLPDGKSFDIGEYTNTIPELLFTNKDITSIPDIVYETVLHIPPELRRDMLSNIFVCGGTTRMNGFCDRLSNELSQRIPEVYFDINRIIKLNLLSQNQFNKYILLGLVDQF